MDPIQYVPVLFLRVGHHGMRARMEREYIRCVNGPLALGMEDDIHGILRTPRPFLLAIVSVCDE